jgi:geranylgeranyl pyrophosphate synthase
MATTLVASELRTDRRLVNDYLDAVLAPRGGACGDPVLETIRYAVLGGGQRLRPLLALRTARMLGSQGEGTLRAAAAVELVHCASLVIDDLPCMDNSTLRRGRPCTHIVFGEPVAILASFAMVSMAARLPLEGLRGGGEWEGNALRFQTRLLATLDCGSLVAGQALDLQLTGEARQRKLSQISELKTVPLFQLAMHAGAVFAPASAAAIAEEQLDACGREFGLLYQALDDYLDGETHDARSLEEHFERVRSYLGSFRGDVRQLENMLDYLHGKALQTDHRHR